jgi:hypothetical protein
MVDRNCKNCKHYKLGSLLPNLEVYGCELWECEYEDKEKKDDRDIPDRTLQSM